MDQNDIALLLLVGVAVYFYSNASQSSVPTFTKCIYPDGTSIQVPRGNVCPIDPSHGGQSVPCVPGSSAPGMEFC